MRILQIGGTGLISAAVTAQAQAAGHEVSLLTRGSSVPGVTTLTADATDPVALRKTLQGRAFDVVVQWIGFTPEQIAADLETFADVGQYVFISSASVYEKPPSSWLITEQTPTVNPYWAYSRQKIACEQVLRASDLSWTIVRPSLTYGDSQLPVALGSWSRPFTLIDRMRRGAKVLVPGDGTSIWTVTHNSDFARGLVGLFGRPEALKEDFHITSDEALTWNQVYKAIAAAAGVVPDLLHVPTDGLVAAAPDLQGTLLGDKVHSTVFDNSKLRSVVPGYAAEVPFVEGIRRTVAWFDADPARQLIDEAANQLWDSVAAVYVEALQRAGRLSQT